MTETIAPEQLWLGAFVGAQVLLVCFCVIKANTYHERALLLHGAATLMSVVAVQVPATSHTQGHGSSLDPRYARGLASATGQSIPEAGQ